MRGIVEGVTALVLANLAFTAPAKAEQIVVSNYGVAANGMPYAIAVEKGFFKQEGADVTGILSSSGHHDPQLARRQSRLWRG